MKFLSEYRGAPASPQVNREARVFFDSRDGVFGCQFLVDNRVVSTEVFGGRSQDYAEDAAENYVLGIKQILLT